MVLSRRESGRPVALFPIGAAGEGAMSTLFIVSAAALSTMAGSLRWGSGLSLSYEHEGGFCRITQSCWLGWRPVEDEELEVARQQAQARRPGAATVQPPAPAPISEAPFRKPDRPGGRAATPVPSPAPEPPRLVVENTRTIDIERFVPRGQIDARYIDKPYYIAPRDPVGQEAFAVIRDALERKQLLGIGRVILQSRDRP